MNTTKVEQNSTVQIGEYKQISPFVNVGSGYARWCVAVRGGKRYFLKQFLAPVQPVLSSDKPTPQFEKRLRLCAAFERKKQSIYDALNSILDPRIVSPVDYFVSDGHYYTAAEYIKQPHQTIMTIQQYSKSVMYQILLSLVECLQLLHQKGFVHSDLKPDHIIIVHDNGLPELRLLDFDSGFLEIMPPQKEDDIEGDPAFLSPEAFLLITGQRIVLNRMLDTFALAIILHLALSGEMPKFNTKRYSYLYACALDEGKFKLSGKIPHKIRKMINLMLQKNPELRPGDDEICNTLKLYAFSS